MPEPQNDSPERLLFVVAAEDAGVRLDRFLAHRIPDWSRSQLQRLIQSGKVMIGAEAARKAGERLAAGVTVRVATDREPLKAQPEDVPLRIVYEDEDLAVIEKPAGMVVHAGAGVRSGTLVNALLHHFGKLSSEGGEWRPGIVHRLDKMTSGLMIVAKNDSAHRAISEQFKSRAIRKTYRALVHGTIVEDRGKISKRVGRDPRRRVRMKAGGIASREAVTDFQVARRYPRFTLLDAMPRTGRTHQLRVHFASLGHPVVGDTLYGASGRVRLSSGEQRTLGRLFLHASSIEFNHPRSGAPLRFQSSLPPELAEFLTAIESAV